MSKSVKNGVAKLLCGDVGAAIIGLVTFSATAGYLGAEVFGVLVLLETYVLIFANFLKPQTWQLLVSHTRNKVYKNRFSELVTLGMIFDLVFVIFSFVLAYSILPFYFEIMNIPPGYQLIGWLILAQLLFNVDGVAIGLLRITEQHGISAIRGIVIATIKLLFVLFVVVTDQGAIGVGVAVLSSKFLGIVYLNLLTYRAIIKEYKYKLSFLSRNEVIELCKFVFFTGATAGLKTSFRELDVLVVGKMLDLTDVASLQVVKKIISVPLRLSNPLGNVIYVKFSKLVSDGLYPQYKALKRRSYLVIFCYVFFVILCMVLLPESLLGRIFESDFEGLKELLVLYSSTMLFTLMCIPSSYSLLAKGLSKHNFNIHLVTSIIYFPLMITSISNIGIEGVPYALLAFGGLRFFALFITDEKND